MKPLISIVMANYNNGEIINKTIESVLNQTYNNIQFIIIDDASTDSSRKVIEKYAKKDKRIEAYFEKENHNFCVASNIGMSKVKGEFITRIDSDDTWEKDKLSKQYDYFSKNKKCDILFTGSNIIDQNDNIVNEQFKEFYEVFNTPQLTREEYIRYLFFKGNCFCHCSVMMKTSLFKEIGLYNNMFIQLQDYEYWIRVIKKVNIYKLDEKLVNVRRFNEKKKNISQINDRNYQRLLNETFLIKEKFLDDIPDDLFIRTFKEYFTNKNASKKEEIECEKIFLLSKICNLEKMITFTNIRQLEKVLNNEKYREKLEKTYHYNINDFYKELGNNLFYDANINNELLVLKHENSTLKTKNESTCLKLKDAEKKLADIKNSTSWKITKPIRKLKEIIK